MNNKDERFINEPWLKWAIEIQAIAQNGLAYSTNQFDNERYNQLRDISAEMMSYKTGISKEKVKNLFCNETGYQTPKIDTRAVVFNDDKILLVRENNGRWSMPGGWCDVLETVKSNTVKEAREESGLNVRTERVIAIQNANKHNVHMLPFGICKIFVLCSVLGGEFKENSETTEADFFDLSDLPELDTVRTTKEQIDMCYKAYKDKNWNVELE